MTEATAAHSYESLSFFWPAVVIGVTALCVLLHDLVEEKQTWLSPGLALFGLAGAGFLLFRDAGARTGMATEVFSGLAVVDPFSTFFQAFFVAVAALAVVISMKSRDIRESKAEYYALLLVLTLGMIMLASANDLLMVYLALETVSIVSYILVAWTQHSRKSSEASLKYVLYGAVASGVMLYGLSLLYGMAGSTSFSDVAAALSMQNSFVVSVAAIMVFAGFGYKIASVPFHMWAPDVYEGAPTPVTAMLTVGPKAAGFAAMIRFFYVVLANPVVGEEGSGTVWAAVDNVAAWPLLIALLSMATMTLGNFAALHQTNVKRLLGYSSIAHAGYLLMGFVVLSEAGLQSVLFYLIVYCAMNMGAFLVVAAVANETGSEEISAFRGLGSRNWIAAVAMTVFLFSLIGLPPLAGFSGKFHLFLGVIEKGNTLATGFNIYYLLVLWAVLNSVVSLYYYARIVKAMYLETTTEAETAQRLRVEPAYVMLMGLLVFPTLVLGVYWQSTLEWAKRSVMLFGSNSL